MKLTVKTLKGSHFKIVVQPGNTIMAVKKNIEEVQGKDSYPWDQQLLIHNGRVLKDESTLEENHVSEDGFIVVMLSKSKTSGTDGASSAQISATSATSHPSPTKAPPQASTTVIPSTTSERPSTTSERASTDVSVGAYGQAASSLVAANNLEQIIQQLLDMGGGNWDRDKVVRALHAAYNNPERAVEYLYSGIPASTEVAVPVDHVPLNQAPGLATDATEAAVGAAAVSGLPNSSPLNMFPQGTPSFSAGIEGGMLDFLRNNEQFQTLRSMVQANPQILQPMLQELSKQNPELVRLIQENQAEFLQLINEASEEGDEGDLFDELPDQETISVTPTEEAAIGRLEAMGFDRDHVIEAFFACNRNEELAANYLLEHSGDDD